MKKLSIRRKEVILIANGLSQLKGIKDFKKSITLGRDVRLLKSIQEKTEEALKFCKPENIDELSVEFRELKQKKAKEFELKDGEVLNDAAIGSHVLLLWPKAVAWTKANMDYNERYEAIQNEEIEVELHTEKIEEKDFEKKPTDVSTGEVLSYFI